MAIYSASVSKVQRSKGQSATASAAYQLRAEITDPTTGEVHDYRRAGGIIDSGATVPDGVPDMTPAELAIMEEAGENRINSTTARKAIIALPHELDDAQRCALAAEISKAVTDTWGVGCAWAVHPPETEKGSDDRNDHAHLQWTTRILSPDGLGKKTREWDDRKTGPAQVEKFREIVEEKTNAALEAAGIDACVDRRSLRAQQATGDAPADVVPTVHEGPGVTAARRRGELVGPATTNETRKQYNAAVIELAAVRGERADRNAASLSGPSVPGRLSDDQAAAWSATVAGREWPENYGGTLGAGAVERVGYINVGRDNLGSPAPAVRVGLVGGGSIIDSGHRITAQTGTPRELSALVALGTARGLDVGPAEQALARALSAPSAAPAAPDGDSGAASRRAQDEALEQRQRQQEEQQEAAQTSRAASGAAAQDRADQAKADRAAEQGDRANHRGRMLQIVGTQQAKPSAMPSGGLTRDEMRAAYDAAIAEANDSGGSGSVGSLDMAPAPGEGGGQVARDRAARQAYKLGGKRAAE